jgi:predicted amidohydrolase
MSLKASYIQTKLYWEQPDKNLEMLASKIEAIAEKSDLIVLPEMFSTGFSMNSEELAENFKSSKSISWMKTQAVKQSACVLGSLIIRDKGCHFNRMIIAFPDETIKYYDKRHRFTYAGEDQHYSAGKDKLIFTYKGWRICPMVCYDLRFPVWIRNRHEYDLLIFVANWPEARVNAWDTLLAARAIENMSYCLGLNRVGEDGNGLNHTGHSCLYDPLGQAMTDEYNETEHVKTIDISKSELEITRKKMAFLEDQDDFELKD